jgi:hypothetical protein
MSVNFIKLHTFTSQEECTLHSNHCENLKLNFVNRVRTEDIAVIVPYKEHRQMKDTEKGLELRFEGKDGCGEPGNGTHEEKVRELDIYQKGKIVGRQRRLEASCLSNHTKQN